MNKQILFLTLALLAIAGCNAESSSDSETNSSKTNSSETSASAIPDAPSNVSAAAGDGGGEITISWNPVYNADSYNLYWATTAGYGKSASKISRVTSPYTHTGRYNESTYYYTITANNASGESSTSNEVAVGKNATKIKTIYATNGAFAALTTAGASLLGVMRMTAAIVQACSSN